jgi:hypothetical protein
MIVEPLEGAHDRRRRGVALHARGAEDQLGAVNDDLHPVRGSHGGPGQLVAEQRRADLAAGVLEREEAVSRCRERRLTDLALDPHVGEDRIGVEQAAHAPIEIGDAQDARRGSNGC